MFVRVYTEATLSGLDGLALMLAVLISFIMLLSAALVFFTACRDGSPERDDLEQYSRSVERAEQRRRGLRHFDRSQWGSLNAQYGNWNKPHRASRSGLGPLRIFLIGGPLAVVLIWLIAAEPLRAFTDSPPAVFRRC